MPVQNEPLLDFFGIPQIILDPAVEIVGYALHELYSPIGQVKIGGKILGEIIKEIVITVKRQPIRSYDVLYTVLPQAS